MTPVLAEEQRIAALRRYNLLDTPHEEDFDEIVELASRICNAPMSLISLIDEDRQWFKAKVGLEGDETPRKYAFCDHAIRLDDLMVVPNATEDERFKDNPYVTSDPDVRFYAGMPIITSDGYKLGTLCVIDRVPRELNSDQLSALRTLAKQVMRLIDIRHNMTKLEQYSEQISRQKQELEKLNAVKDKVFSIIAHDLRGPIGNISNLMMFFIEGTLNEQELRELFKQLGVTVHETSDMLDNLLNWAKNYIKDEEVVHERFNLKAVIEAKLALYEAAAAAKGITLTTQISDSVYVYADINMLRVILRNLISNAIKFCTNGNTISVTAEVKANVVTVLVKDNGKGISTGNQALLFKDHEHLTTYGTANEKGTGLGLILCREFVNKNGGEIWCESEEGKGSVFYFTLPEAQLD